MDASSHVLVVTADFNASVKIADAAKTLGARCMMVRSPAELPAKLALGSPDLVVLDLQLAGLDPASVVQMVRQDDGATPVIAFGRHTEAASLRAARQAGCAEVLARSDFFPRLPEVLGKHLGPRG